jgi:cytosine/adenosine deaminase-related metal-dependent hydrolase
MDKPRIALILLLIFGTGGLPLPTQADARKVDPSAGGGAASSPARSIGLSGSETAGLWGASKGILIDGATVVTMNDSHKVIEGAKVLVRYGKIVAIWTGRTPPAGVVIGQASVIEAGPEDLLFPGLINLHNHPSFNELHTWPPPSSHAIPSAGKSGTDPYSNRYQWGGGGAKNPPKSLQRLIQNPSEVLTANWGLHLFGEIVKYSEVAALLGGETSIQGVSDGNEFDKILVRNVGSANAFGGKAASWVPSVESLISGTKDDDVRQAMHDGDIDAWLVHLAEGVDQSSHEEFQTLKDNDLLTDMTVVIHGIALNGADFAAMRAAPSNRPGGVGDGRGAKLVWSPLSNLLLYGATANFYKAYKAGVLVSLGTDWSPSGSRTLLQELKIADVALRDPRILGDSRELVPAFSLQGRTGLQKLLAERALDRALVDMVTRNPALTLRWYDSVGSVEVGKAADLLLIHRPSADQPGDSPSVYRELIDATEADVSLVLVGGEPLAGDVTVMHALKGRDTEIVTSPLGGFDKAVDATKPSVVAGDQTVASIAAQLEVALSALGGEKDGAGNQTYSFLKANLLNGFYEAKTNERFEDFLATKVGRRRDGSLNIESIQLAPLLTVDNDFLSHILRAEVDENGLIADPTPPFTLYAANFNQVTPQGNPFAGWSAEAP